MVLEMVGPKVASVWMDVQASLLLFAVLWATVKVSYERASGRPMPRNKVTLFFDVVVEFANNLPGALHRTSKVTGGPGMFQSQKMKEE